MREWEIEGEKNKNKFFPAARREKRNVVKPRRRTVTMEFQTIKRRCHLRLTVDRVAFNIKGPCPICCSICILAAAARKHGNSRATDKYVLCENKVGNVISFRV